MKSIRKTLTRRLSIIISLLVITVLLGADIGVDNWVESEFNHAMKAKVGVLQTLASQNNDRVEFESAGEYLPEFKGTTSPEYFQLWNNEHVFEKSETLNLHSAKDFPYKSVELNKFLIEEITLPDGRTGRIIYSRFIPQTAPQNIQASYQSNSNIENHTMLIAYATSTESLNFTLWFIDAAFVLTLIFVPLAVRFAVKNTVSYALAPLDALNNRIKDSRFSETQTRVVFENEVEELAPITESLNHFIEENYALYVREKRLTSDIAHELKTPVTELINMTEVALRFPGEERLEKDFKPNVLEIGTRMKNIISGLMTIQKYAYQKIDQNEEINLQTLLGKVVSAKQYTRIVIVKGGSQAPIVRSNLFAVESIISNLLNNAVQHSKGDNEINVYIGSTKLGEAQLRVRNVVKANVQESDISHMFEPLWQKDSARSSQDNFGLGLSIVRTLANAISANVSAALHEDRIEFVVTFANQA
ncbi:sensor histidine kinase [Alteromonas pelagimontana]|uniref:histidine kinase n=1 Tax=Alteromonas pelagimontana TaxID=1858656 RepID=A0A6M4MF40_9ALTE|nr:HAMP domain-containing sensor histidine kinase [Alteromonas pelagimontana]QJR81488.1 sensor histidine kinase [Alteromonas pelagimontana]